MGFLQRYGKAISNVAVVLLVLGACYVKSQDAAAAPLFRASDAWLLAGAVLGLILLRWYAKRRRQDK